MNLDLLHTASSPQSAVESVMKIAQLAASLKATTKFENLAYFDFCSAIHLSVRASSRSSGKVPPFSISS